MQEKTLDWNEFEKAIDNLAENIKKENEKFDWIISVNRGGLMPGVLLSHKLGIKNHGVVTVTTYEQRKKRNSLQKDIYVSCRGIQYFKGKALVVDDIIRTGETVAEAVKIVGKDRDIKNIKTMSLFRATDRGVFVPDYYYDIIPEKTWIKLPWENEVKVNDSEMPKLQLQHR